LSAGIGQQRGLAGHAALAAWYSHNFDNDFALHVAADIISNAELEMDMSLENDWQLLYRILCRYFDWARKNDNFSEIIQTEQKFEIEIGGAPIIGYIDGVVKIKDSLWLLENKFNKRVSLNHIDIDPQMSLYMLAAYRSGIEVKGILFNVIRMTEGGIAETQPVVRTQVYRNTEGLALIEKEVAVQVQEMLEYHEKGGYTYRNPTGDCSWDCGFFSACLSINDDGNVHSALARIPIVKRVETIEDPRKEDI